MNPRKCGFFIRDWENSTSYKPIWGHLQVDEDGDPLFFNQQPSAPPLGKSSSLRFYNGLWDSPGSAAKYPHHPGGCAPDCPRLGLNSVRRLPERPLAILVALGLVKDDDGFPEVLKQAKMTDKQVRHLRAAGGASTGGLTHYLPSASRKLGPNKERNALFNNLHPNPNARPPIPFQCHWKGKFLDMGPFDGILPLFQLDEALQNGQEALPMQDLLQGPPDSSGLKRSSPGIVHQIWKGRCIPESWAPYVATWGNQPKVQHYVLWTDAAMDALVLNHFDCTVLSYVWRYLSTVKGSFKARISEMVKRSDIFRFLILYVYGGFYADMDISSTSYDVSKLKDDHSVSIAWEPPYAQYDYKMPKSDYDLKGNGRLVLIAFLAVKAPGNDFIRFVLERQLEWMMLRSTAESRSSDPWWGFRISHAGNAVTETGPSLVARAYHSYAARASADRVTVNDMRYEEDFLPWAAHHGSCSWCPRGKKTKK